MNSRIAIVGGGGGVGASLAFNLLLARGAVRRRAGRRPLRAWPARTRWTSSRSSPQGASGSIEIVELGAIADADVVVISAAVPLTVNRSRMVYLRDNAAIVAEIGDRAAGRLAGRRADGHQPRRPALHAAAARRGLDRRRAARLHRQRQPAPADRDRRPARRAARARSTPGCSASTATASCRCSTASGSTASRSTLDAAAGARPPSASCASWYEQPRRARLRPLLDLDHRARPRPHGRGAHERRGRAVARLGRARRRVRRRRRRAERAGHARPRRRARAARVGADRQQRAAMAAAGEAVRAAADGLERCVRAPGPPAASCRLSTIVLIMLVR